MAVRVLSAGLLAAGLLTALAGCGQKVVTDPPPQVVTPATPEEKLVEQMRSGGVQAKAVVETIEDASALVSQRLSGAAGDEKDALNEVNDFLSSAGDACAEWGVEPPALAEVTGSFAKYDDQRLAAITDLNDALMDLRSAEGAASSLAEAEASYSELLQLVQLASKDLSEAIQAYGGQVEEESPEEAPPTGP